MIKGKCQEIKFAINNYVIPTIREKSVKKGSVAAIPFHLLIVTGGKIF